MDWLGRWHAQLPFSYVWHECNGDVWLDPRVERTTPEQMPEVFRARFHRPL
jgi:hypothetical protein